MFSSKQKIIKSMFSLKSVKKVEKVISKLFLFNEGIRRNEKSRGIREVDDDGEDVRFLSSSSSNDGEDGDNNDDGDSSDGGGGDDDNNRGNNSADGGLIVICKGWVWHQTNIMV